MLLFKIYVIYYIISNENIILHNLGGNSLMKQKNLKLLKKEPKDIKKYKKI